MVNWSLGSVAAEMNNLVENIPVAISGATLLALIDRTRLFMESFTGETIGSTGIAEKYQPALVDLSVANLLEHMEIVGADVSSVSLGELSIGKGKGGNLSSAKESIRERGMKILETYGTEVRFYATST